MRYQFIVSAKAQEDLHTCRERDISAARRIAVLLREISDDIRACEGLVDTRFYDEKIESVDYLWTLQDRRINGYRVRFVELRRWRLIVVADHLARKVGLFAIMPREDDYSTELAQRVERECDDYDFARLKA